MLIFELPLLSVFVVCFPGCLLLDLEATDLTTIVHYIVENMVIRDQIREEDKANILRTLLLKHK